MVGDELGDDLFGCLPAMIQNPEAWPENYAAGFNDALANVGDALPEIRMRLDDLQVAVAQAVAFAEYVDAHAKGKMEEAAKRFLSQSFADGVRKRLSAAAPRDGWVFHSGCTWWDTEGKMHIDNTYVRDPSP